MQIRRMTATFGKIAQESLELSGGLNILQAPNEGGKSTWAVFILSMLYGINSRERDRAGYIADKNHYAPWSGTPMSGRLECRAGDMEITLIRETRRQSAPMGAFQALFSGTGTAVPDLTGTACGEALLGVSREVYERSAFIRQAGLPLSQDAGLEKRIAALITSGEEETSYSEAANTLKKQMNRRRHNKTGQLPAMEAELAEIRRQLALHDSLHAQLLQVQREVEHFIGQEAALTAQLALHGRWEAQQARQALLDAEEAADQSARQAAGLRQQMEAEHLPENETIARLRGAIVNLETVRKNTDKAMAEKDAAAEALLQAQAAVNATPFAGYTPEQAEKLPLHLSKKPAPSLRLFLSLLALGLGFGIAIYAVQQSLLLAIGGGGGLFGLAALLAGLLIGQKQNRWEAQATELRLQRQRELTAFAALYQAAESAREKAAAASAAYAGLHQALITNEQGILLEVRRFAPAAFDIPAADSALVSCARRRKELFAAETAAREAALRLEYQRESCPEQPEEGGAPVSPPDQSRAELEAKLALTRQSLSSVRSTADRLAGQLSALEDRAALQAQADRLEYQLEAVQGEYDAIALALDALEQSNAELQTRFSPALGRRTAEIFAELTGGMYSGTALDRDLHLSASPAGSPILRDVQLLSTGTADQLYLAARLAICQMVLPREDPPPLVLDDALVNFDDARCAAALQYLRREAENRQILLFTCHSRESEFFAGDKEVSVQRLTNSASRV